MSKTAVAVLQETAMKHGFVPVYEEIASINGTHNNKFAIRVRCNNTTADGLAMTKKQAKQNAAREMLMLLTKSNLFPLSVLSSLPPMAPSEPLPQQNKKDSDESSAQINNSAMDSPDSLQSSNSRANSPVLETQSEETFVNYIGKLKELCHTKHLPEAQFEVLSITGSSHQPVFTMTGSIESVKEKATANSKKKAKHEVAKKLLKRVLKAPNTEVAAKIPKLSTKEGIFADSRAHSESQSRMSRGGSCPP